MTQSFDDSPDADGSLDSDAGVDRKQLAQIKREFLSINQEKHARALACLSERQQQFLSLIPLLFHVNHPMLPGYSSLQAPIGVNAYTPSDVDIRLAKNIARSFSYTRSLLEKRPAIEALFIMGSLGSIAHSGTSDLDVWVCCNNYVNAAEREALREKCKKLTLWAADTIHIEANFFIMDAEKFTQGQQSLMSSDASGSAQHYLLLDEFYRTAIWLAGKIPLWWFVPADQESNYDEYSKNLLNKRFLRESDLIDFGGIPKFPANEFIGAGVWQLYKAIDSPYKSVLKLLLLEVYASDQGNEPLALDVKRTIYTAITKHSITANDLDSYVLIYKRIEQYLIARNELDRLELIRRCFYFKSGKSISKIIHTPTKSWQVNLLEKMTAEWGWQKFQLALLDSRATWKAVQVLAERELLASELQKSYGLLTKMQDNIDNKAAINGEELLLLGRKLHAAFERKSGKIDFINPKISQDIQEPVLCFVESIEADVSLWKVYATTEQYLLTHQHVSEPLKICNNFIEALLWCYCNAIAGINTKLDIVSKKITLQPNQLQQVWQALKHWLPMPEKTPEHERFTKNSYSTHVLLLLNIGLEPQADLQKKGMQMLSNQSDAFGYSGLKENLVLTADIIQRNSFGEITCHYYENNALLNCLLHYLRLIPPHSTNILPELSIQCFSRSQGKIIEQRVIGLWRAITSCFYVNYHGRNPRFIFEMAGDFLLLQFIQQQPQLFRFKHYEKLLEKLSAPQVEPSVIVVDSVALKDQPLRIIAEVVKKPEIYLFYKTDEDIVNINVVDQKGSLFTKAFNLFNTKTAARVFYHFIAAVMSRHASLYPLHPPLAQKINLYEIVADTQHKNAHVLMREIEPENKNLPFINICAIAEPIESLPLRFTISCEGRKFSEAQFGDQLYQEVANYIIKSRQSPERYPCYITDLDVSLCKDFIAPQMAVQLIHYLDIKNEIEEKLRIALETV